ncbi:Uncharacterized conserved protein, DUF2252 family [Enhydrobacter aerosaccus]|uniref:Uncharacterized conserved protein, DUF2252 family n=1 Tax=Enhydrobacter aerosaccus TaxID=225324 RepID=A0A1T4K962_9HYPH|nr:DUF2252 domain-containing protein [Enhydrobacter aerosaccus]SJZ38982.1 Uncharacterized conserved protein, DUF2252 family [Enhydrobacter aerosaccus]
MSSAPKNNIDQDFFGFLSHRDQLGSLQNFTGSRPSRAERMEMGRQLRKTVPRTSHAAWTPRADRADPVDILMAQNATRVQKLVPLRNARMLASPFTFLRGAAAVMAADLATTPATGLNVVACGDMHVANFGVFASAERKLIFAINDFDEVHPGPWEWDLKRLAASAAVAASDMGADRVGAEEAARAAVASWRERLRGYAEMPFLEVWYDEIDDRTILDAASPRLRTQIEAIFDKARAKGHIRSLDKLTEDVAGQHRLIEIAPVLVRETHREDGVPMAEVIDDVLRSYFHSLPDDRKRLMSRYRLVDVARKVVGVGSVGTSCWVAFLQGLDDDDPLFLQIKEAQRSVLAPYAPISLPYTHQGQRVVVGQRLTQGAPDIFLGWGDSTYGRQFYVRQLADMKGGARFGEGVTETLDGFASYCRLCGWALALAHAKSGDAAMMAGYVGKGDTLDEAIGRFALAYLEQTERDHDRFAAARRAGRISASLETVPPG